jgi:signal transduction histidine kinase
MLLAFTVGFVAFGAVLSESAPSDAAAALDLLAGLVALGLLPFRRRAPLLVACLITVLASVSSFSIGALVIATVSLATRRRWREVVPVAVLWFLSTMVFEVVTEPADPLELWVVALITLAVLVPTVLAGFSIGGRRELFAVLQARAETAEREQAARVAQARTAERAAIAREMHDVLAHRISLVAMHSGALAYRTDLTADETTEVATVIRDNAHLALTELREVLGVLRAPEVRWSTATGPAAPPERPQPTLATLDELLDETRAAGTPVTLRVPVEPAVLAALAPSTGRTAFRVVQEALTNARKHAPGRPVTLTVDGAPGSSLTIVASNTTDGPPPGLGEPALPSSGLGLTGLAERVSLAGGHLEHGVDDHGTFTVRAWVPWTS